MKRRGPFIATAIAIAVVLAAGLGAYRGEKDDDEYPPGGESCEGEHLRFIHGMCESDHKMGICEGVPEEFAEACKAGCVMGFCPAQVFECAEGATAWCAPCNDMQSARFWYNLHAADSRCNYKLQMLDPKSTESKDRVFAECCDRDVEQHCPALAGTDWLAQLRAVMSP